VPDVITCLGIIWVRAAAWMAPKPSHLSERDAPRIATPLTALIFALLFFQLVLRRGIAY